MQTYTVKVNTNVYHARRHTYNYYIVQCIACSLPYSLLVTSLHKNCLGAGEPYDTDQLVVKYSIVLVWLKDFGF